MTTHLKIITIYDEWVGVRGLGGESIVFLDLVIWFIWGIDTKKEVIKKGIWFLEKVVWLNKLVKQLKNKIKGLKGETRVWKNC